MAGRRQTRQLKKAFLKHYAELGNISRAAFMAHIDRDSHYRWLKEDPAYAKAFESAHEQACGALEDEAVRRARQGVLEPVFHKGRVCGTIRRYSDTLLIFLIKGAMPHKYAERSKVDATIEVGESVMERLASARKRVNGD